MTNMKNLTCLLLIAVVALSCKSGNTSIKNDLELANLKGSVSQIDKTFHDASAKCVCPAAQKSECNQMSYMYDKKGNLIESTGVDENGAVALKTKYNYNRKGLCEEVQHLSGDNITGKEVTTFQGCRAVAVKAYGEEGKLNSSYKYRYTGDDLSEEQSFNDRGEITGTYSNKIENGQLVERTEKDKEGNILSIKTFKRNSNSDISELTIQVPQNNAEYKLTFEYDYDDHGNWIRQTQTYNGEIQNITIRNITYYDI
jgi:hypothetical protein